MIKICHVISGDLWAGAEVMTYNLLKGLKAYPGLITMVVILNHGKLTVLVRKLEIQVHVIDESRLSFLQLLLELRKIVQRFQPDVIHSHRYKEHMLAYFASRSYHQAALIATQHGMPETYNGQDGLWNRVKSQLNYHVLSRRFDCTVAVSDDIRQQFVQRHGFYENKLQVIHNGMEIHPSSRSPKQATCFNIGSSGRLFPVKDYPLMVESARIISQAEDNIRFRIAGDGPESGSIQKLIEKHGLQRIFKLDGFLDDMRGFYGSLDLYMNTSIHEGIPMSILEAMAHQVPIVAPKVGGIREVVLHGVNGYLIETRDPADFAKVCIHLYRNRKLHQSMSVAARERVAEEFSMELMAHRYYDLYVGCVGKEAKLCRAA